MKDEAAAARRLAEGEEEDDPENIASRAGVEPSATLAMAAKAKELTAAGKTVYDI